MNQPEKKSPMTHAEAMTIRAAVIAFFTRCMIEDAAEQARQETRS